MAAKISLSAAISELKTMGQRTRHILAVLAVSTALCADQAVIAAPTRPTAGQELAQMAGRLVDQLSRSFRRVTLATWPTDMPRRWSERRAMPQPVCAASAVVLAHTLISPFQFRLPPPVASGILV
ncbi:MAG TPA: hypothetical protein VHY37_05245 [Tepidisphaeraceae bacterium]|nr:hypothetical protein [Tepidisphaeraceae bacterium]